MPPAVILIILLLSGRRNDSFIKVERNVAGNITRRTDVRKQEVLDRFSRVRGDNVENCWADQGVNASVRKGTKTDAPSTRATVARSNTISEAPSFA